jgi:hypothetical protein
MEFIVSTNFMGFVPSISGAFINFFKLLGILVIVDKIKVWLSKKFKKSNWLFIFFMFLLRKPVLIYSLYLFWYIWAALSLYKFTDNVLLANIALQSAISMFIGIVFGAFAFLKNSRKNVK